MIIYRPELRKRNIAILLPFAQLSKGEGTGGRDGGAVLVSQLML